MEILTGLQSYRVRSSLRHYCISASHPQRKSCGNLASITQLFNPSFRRWRWRLSAENRGKFSWIDSFRSKGTSELNWFPLLIKGGGIYLCFGKCTEWFLFGKNLQEGLVVVILELFERLPNLLFQEEFYCRNFVSNFRIFHSISG